MAGSQVHRVNAFRFSEGVVLLTLLIRFPDMEVSMSGGKANDETSLKGGDIHGVTDSAV
jgi:hypothetical protein